MPPNTRNGGSKAKGKARKPDAPAEPAYAPECYACPIGTASMAVQRLRPDATEHLFRAGREMLLVLRSVLDAAADMLTTMEERGQGAARIQDIPVRRG